MIIFPPDINTRTSKLHILYFIMLILGREGVSDQPWLGSWNDNVTVSMVSCGGSQYKQGKFRLHNGNTFLVLI